MSNHHLNPETLAAEKTAHLILPAPRAAQPEDRLAPSRLLAPLSPVIASWRRHAHPGGTRVVIRFKNGYGAIISEEPRPAGTYEIAPLRFHGRGPEDYEFYFRSHVPDLTWCSGSDEIIQVCKQIARLLPPNQV
jgi:hypothetical protein